MEQQPVIVEAEIGARIKAFRTEKGITLAQLAKMTGFSKGYLSKVEKSDKAPPVSTLLTIARALGITISALLGEDPQRTSLCLVRKDQRTVITRDGTRFGYAYEGLACKYPNRTMEPYVLTLPVGPRKRTLFQHEGEEILFVLQGTMKFTHNGVEYIANEGDCLYFDSGVLHIGEALGTEEVKCFMVMCNPFTPERIQRQNGSK